MGGFGAPLGAGDQGRVRRCHRVDAHRPILASVRQSRDDGILERATGIEPVSLAWKARVLPLHNARSAGRVGNSHSRKGQADY